MNLNDLSRPLEISSVDFRVQSINNGGYATILAYKDARIDMARLDAVVGPLGWQRKHELINGRLFCHVGIYDEKTSEWVWKSDVGTESNTEAEKGQASDSFKRACFNWGIGRELYSYPVISVKLNADEWTSDGGRPRQTFNLKIKDWRWYSEFTDGNITFLAAKDQNGILRFKWGQMKPKNEEPTYKPASGGEPESHAENVPTEKEEANPQGVLKKEAVIISKDAGNEREKLVEEYEKLYGRKPHGRMSIEGIKKEIEAYEPIEDEDDDELVNENVDESVLEEVEDDDVDDYVNEEEDEEIELLEEDEDDDEPGVFSITREFDNISEYKDPSTFVSWAKSTVAKYIDVESEEKIEEFKTLCNAHYTKIAAK